jgi:hypothetical protein
MHGGMAPQALRSAAERLAALVDPALAALAQLVDSAESDMVRLAAIKDVLDRAGYKPRERVEQSSTLKVEIVYSDGPGPDSPYQPQTPALGPATDQA